MHASAIALSSFFDVAPYYYEALLASTCRLPSIWLFSVFCWHAQLPGRWRECSMHGTTRHLRVITPATFFPLFSQVRACEEKIRAMEGAEDCLLSASGMCSATTMLLALVPAGGHIVTTTDCYRRTRQFIQTFLPKMGIEATVIDPSDLKTLAKTLEEKKARQRAEPPAVAVAFESGFAFQALLIR